MGLRGNISLKQRVVGFLASVSIALAVSCPASAQDGWRLLEGGLKLLQALTLSDEDIQPYVSQAVEELDRENTVLRSGAYVTRLNRITRGLTSINGIPLNFKVYQTPEINAFACSDGSIRVYTGLMDVMTDNEILAVIGHEIGHVVLRHTLNAYKEALIVSAAIDAIASTGDTAAVLSDSILGELAQIMLDLSYSRTQESQADDYAYSFMVDQGKNPWHIAKAFEKLESASTSGTSEQISSVMKLFSTHPDTASRIQIISARAREDGYREP